jgi:hypothetical protein
MVNRLHACVIIRGETEKRQTVSNSSEMLVYKDPACSSFPYNSPNRSETMFGEKDVSENSRYRISQRGGDFPMVQLLFETSDLLI